MPREPLDAVENLPKEAPRQVALGQLEHEEPSMPDKAPASLEQPLLEIREGPALDGDGQDPARGTERWWVRSSKGTWIALGTTGTRVPPGGSSRRGLGARASVPSQVPFSARRPSARSRRLRDEDDATSRGRHAPRCRREGIDSEAANGNSSAYRALPYWHRFLTAPRRPVGAFDHNE